MRLTVIPTVVGTLGTVAKGLEKRLEDFYIKGRIDTTQITALSRLARMLRVVPGA